jgi:hypothetical protein
VLTFLVESFIHAQAPPQTQNQSRYHDLQAAGFIYPSRRSRPFFSGFNGWLPNPDPVLRKMGRQISVYRELMRDPCPCGRIFLHLHKTPFFSLHNTA